MLIVKIYELVIHKVFNKLMNIIYGNLNEKLTLKMVISVIKHKYFC